MLVEDASGVLFAVGAEVTAEFVVVEACTNKGLQKDRKKEKPNSKKTTTTLCEYRTQTNKQAAIAAFVQIWQKVSLEV